LKVDSRKVRAVEFLAPPTCRKELLSFLGLAGYYRKFVHKYATMVAPLSDLTKATSAWTWTAEHAHSFTSIKLALQQSPVLALPNYDVPFVITTDASGIACGAVLSQLDADGNDRPVAFMSKRLSDTESRWPAYEQELFVIYLAMSKWRPYVHGQHFDVYTDNSTAQVFLGHGRPHAQADALDGLLQPIRLPAVSPQGYGQRRRGRTLAAARPAYVGCTVGLDLGHH
jgi:hypothetical protein